MRVPWYLVLVLIIAVVGGVWALGTRGMDFMTPKGVALGPEDRGESLVEGIFSGDAPGTVNPEIIAPAVTEAESEMPKTERLDLGTLDVSPGLYEYLPMAENGPEHLFRLVSALQTQGRFQRALLVLERVIDATEATPEQKLEAATGIKALVPTLPPWNIDPRAQVPLQFRLGTARPGEEELKSAALGVALLVQHHSGEQLEMTPVISTGSPETAVPNGPIALWVATEGDPSASTAVLSITPQPEDDLEETFALALYKLVRGHLARSGYSTDSPPTGVTGSDLLSYHITRRMWYDFGQAMLNEQKALGGGVPGVTEEESDGAEMAEDVDED